MKKLYLAYGSNLNVGQMKNRCPPATRKGTAYIKGYRLLYKGSRTGSFLTIEKAKGRKVPVGVWEVGPGDERRLDWYEGYPTFYYKKTVKVILEETGEEVEAFVYIMHEERQLGIPSTFYVKVCEEGYENFGFDKKYLDRAYKESKEGLQWN